MAEPQHGRNIYDQHFFALPEARFPRQDSGPLGGKPTPWNKAGIKPVKPVKFNNNQGRFHMWYTGRKSADSRDEFFPGMYVSRKKPVPRTPHSRHLGMCLSMGFIVVLFLAIVGLTAWALIPEKKEIPDKTVRYCAVVSISENGAPKGILPKDVSSPEAKAIEKHYCDAVKDAFGDAYRDCAVPFPTYYSCFMLYDSRLSFYEEKLRARLGKNDTSFALTTATMEASVQEMMFGERYSVFNQSKLILLSDCRQKNLGKYFFEMNATVPRNNETVHKAVLQTPAAFLCGEAHRAYSSSNMKDVYEGCEVQHVRVTATEETIAVDAKWLFTVDEDTLKSVADNDASRPAGMTYKEYMLSLVLEEVVEHPNHYPLLNLFKYVTDTIGKKANVGDDSDSRGEEKPTRLSHAQQTALEDDHHKCAGYAVA